MDSVGKFFEHTKVSNFRRLVNQENSSKLLANSRNFQRIHIINFLTDSLFIRWISFRAFSRFPATKCLGPLDGSTDRLTNRPTDLPADRLLAVQIAILSVNMLRGTPSASLFYTL